MDTLVVLRAFFQDIDEYTIHKLGNGLIHKTYRIDIDGNNFLLQEINTHVFQNAEALMHNIVKVANHLKKKNYPYILEPHLTLEGKYHLEFNGKVFRIFPFFRNLIAYDHFESLEQIKEAAKAYSTFIWQITDLDHTFWYIPIPDFHNLAVRFNQLNQTKKAANLNPKLTALYKKCSELNKKIEFLLDKVSYKTMPLRLVHNDTKASNLLFNENQQAKAVIDWDTIMSGYVFYDVGDCIRTLAVDVAEDEIDEKRMILVSKKVETFISAYKASSDWLTQQEVDSLQISGGYMSLIMAVRFLTDAIQGNQYFHCEYPEHNYTRARNQLILTHQFLETN